MFSYSDVRDLVVEKFSRLGQPAAAVTCDRITSAAGHSVGTAFMAGSLRADWLYERDVIIFRRGGTLLRLVAVGDSVAARCRAA